VLLFFSAQRGVFSCEVRDVTNVGAQIRLNGLNILPPILELSFDNFRTVRKCRLIWRLGDLIGIAFEN
jgi:ribosomal protein S1